MKCNTCGKMNCMAHGGELNTDRSEDVNMMTGKSGMVRHSKPGSDREKGINKVGSHGRSAGYSEAGAYYRAGQHGQKGGQETAKDIHRETLSESRALPKPKLKGLARGGAVEDDQMNMYPMSPDVPSMHPKTMAEGGDVEMDSEIESMIGDELMDAFERKDKAGILEAIKALVMSCGGKL